MQSEYLDILETIDIDPPHEFRIEGEWFTAGGITPDGRCWVAPSEEFFERWLIDDALSDRLTELGFEFAFDGTAVGVWQEFIFYCPPMALTANRRPRTAVRE